jgi:SAM-dependent methyltransferase
VKRSATLQQNLREMERAREAYWLRYPGTSPTKLRWRALTVRHCFHVLPGEAILELGAGSGLWTEHLAAVLGGENPIIAAVFNDDLAAAAARRNLPNTQVLRVADFGAELPAEHFDYVVGTAILCHDHYAQNLRAIYRLLKPGGQCLFFEANYWNPQVLLKSLCPPLGRWAGNASCQVGMRRYRLLEIASHQGFTHVDVIPYDIVHPLTPQALVSAVQSLAFILEHTPVVRELCGTLYIWATKPAPGGRRRTRVGLADRRELFGSVSVVVPCHNEEMNVVRLVDALVEFYDDYIFEIVVVDDNSTDRTAEAARQVARREPRVKVLRREPPNGVGRALREGFAAATGRYILTIDCDFVQIVPELRDLFDVVADGHDGAIGSRFSHSSILINYPFFKILSNRLFHFIINLMFPFHVRDISNNLKLYRADILASLRIEADDFAANVETGLGPLLAGYDVVEVPVSWIDRTAEMGESSFRIVRLAPGYVAALLRLAWRRWA